MILRQTKQHVHVVRDAADDQSWAFPFFQNAGLIGEQSRPILGDNEGARSLVL